MLKTILSVDSQTIHSTHAGELWAQRTLLTGGGKLARRVDECKDSRRSCQGLFDREKR
jgi:hypothetical protein